MKTKFQILSLLLIILPSIVNAARQYDVELVAFQRFHGGQNEYWPSEPGEPDRTKANHLLYKSSSDSPAMLDEPGRIMLTKGQKKLGPIAYTLRKKGYPIHLNIGWRQPVKGWKSNDWNWVETDNLRGLIRITRGKFLHLDVDLLLTDRQSGEQYRIQSSRKMRSNELHHIDHPKLGLIVRANKWFPPEETVTSGN